MASQTFDLTLHSALYDHGAIQMAILHCSGTQQNYSKLFHVFSLSLLLGCSVERRGRKNFSMSDMAKTSQIRKCVKSPTQAKKTPKTQLEAKPSLAYTAPRSFSRHIAHQLFHDTRLPSSTRHLNLPCTLCTGLQAILLAFPQWWIRRSGIILDASAGSGTTCNQPARDS